VTRSIWAIVYGGLISAAAKMAMTYLLLEGERNRFDFEPEAFREISGFGRWVFLSTSLSFLTGQIDRFVLGRPSRSPSSASTASHSISPRCLRA
jgi:O-antigen/teichoic acid export membrane protein